jgi:hypothetical protein
MLQIVSSPWLTPSVLCEGVDTSPGSNKCRVKELLRSTGTLQPELPGQHKDREDDTITNEGATHNEMSQALPEMVVSAISHGCYASKKHLCPTNDWKKLSQYSVRGHKVTACAPEHTLFQVELEIYAKNDLGCKHEAQSTGEPGVDIGCELAALVFMAKEVRDQSKDYAN